jgi:hypothetical protein
MIPVPLKIEDLPSVLLVDRAQLPALAGIYILVSKGIPRYVGRSVNLRQRWQGHHQRAAASRLSDARVYYLILSADASLCRLERAMQRLTASVTEPLTPPRAIKDVRLETVGVRINRGEHRALTRIAKQNQWTISQTARKLIEQALTTNGNKRKSK